ncbi:MAG: VWA domain-containing protein, partial [Victivallales bacterium]|nr:VWA domain-containing protein [Victivallales bacterium]
MKFAFPLFLLLYIPFLILLLVAARHRDPTLLIPSIRPFTKANPGRKLHLLFGIPFLLNAAALALLIFALARPQKGLEMIRQRAEGIDIMIVLDISGSMAAVDIPDKKTTDKEIFDAMKRGSLKPRSDIAKQKIKQFVKRRPNDRIGLIAFAPLPYLASPPTLHHEWLFAHLDRLRP